MAENAANNHNCKQKEEKLYSVMENFGIPKSAVTPLLENLLKKYDNRWDFIEAQDYRVVVEHYFRQMNEDTKNILFRGGDGGTGISNLKRVCCNKEDDQKIGNCEDGSNCLLVPLPTPVTRAVHGTRSWSAGSVHPIANSSPVPRIPSRHSSPFAGGGVSQLERVNFSDQMMAYHSGVSPYQPTERREPPPQIESSNFADAIMAFHSGVSPCPRAGGKGPSLQNGGAGPRARVGEGGRRSHHDDPDFIVAVAAHAKGKGKLPFGVATLLRNIGEVPNANLLFPEIVPEDQGVKHGKIPSSTNLNLQDAKNSRREGRISVRCGERGHHNDPDSIVAVAAHAKGKGKLTFGVVTLPRNREEVPDANLLRPEILPEDQDVKHGKIPSPTNSNLQDAKVSCRKEGISARCGSQKRPCISRSDSETTANAEPCIKNRIASMTDIDIIEEVLTSARHTEVRNQAGSNSNKDQAPLWRIDNVTGFSTGPEGRCDQIEERDTTPGILQVERQRRPVIDENQIDHIESVEEKECNPTEEERDTPVDVPQEEREKNSCDDTNLNAGDPFSISSTWDRADDLQKNTQKNAQNIVPDDAYLIQSGYLPITDDIIEGIRGADCMDIMSRLKLTQFASLPWGHRQEIDLADMRIFIEDEIWSPARSREAEAWIERVFRLPRGTSKMPRRSQTLRPGGSADPHPHFFAESRRGTARYYEVTDCLHSQWQAIYQFLLPTFMCRLKRFGLPSYFVCWLLRGDSNDKDYHEAFCYFFLTEIRRLRETRASKLRPTMVFPHILMIMNHHARGTQATMSKNVLQAENNAHDIVQIVGHPESIVEAPSQNFVCRKSERIRSQRLRSEQHSGGAA